MTARVAWQGVFPAVTTQFKEDFSLDIDATARVMDALIRDGVSGLIICGTVGENTGLTRAEKIQIMEAARGVAAGRVPVICGVAEFTTAFAIETAKAAARRWHSPFADRRCWLAVAPDRSRERAWDRTYRPARGRRA